MLPPHRCFSVKDQHPPTSTRTPLQFLPALPNEPCHLATSSCMPDAPDRDVATSCFDPLWPHSWEYEYEYQSIHFLSAELAALTRTPVALKVCLLQTCASFRLLWIFVAIWQEWISPALWQHHARTVSLTWQTAIPRAGAGRYSGTRVVIGGYRFGVILAVMARYVALTREEATYSYHEKKNPHCITSCCCACSVARSIRCFCFFSIIICFLLTRASSLAALSGARSR